MAINQCIRLVNLIIIQPTPNEQGLPNMSPFFPLVINITAETGGVLNVMFFFRPLKMRCKSAQNNTYICLPEDLTHDACFQSDIPATRPNLSCTCRQDWLQPFILLIHDSHFWGWVFPYISRIHTAYIGEYLHFRYLKSLVIDGRNPASC